MSSAVDNNLSRSKFEQSVADAFPVVYRRLASRFRDEQLAEEVSLDCLSQAFELWQSDPKYFATHDLTAWSSRRASWRALDKLRERSRYLALPEENPLDEDGSPRAPVVAAFRTNGTEQARQDRQTVWDELQNLDAEDREVLLSAYYDNLSDQEIGTDLFGDVAGPQALGLRVWRRRQKAQGRLKDRLVAAGVDPADWGGESSQAV